MSKRARWSLILVWTAVCLSPSVSRSEVLLSPQVAPTQTAGAPVPGADDVWRVDPQPVVSLGPFEGELPYRTGVVTGAIRIGDRIVVADAAARELRYFDLEGVLQRTIGSAEFRYLSQLSRCEGELVYAFNYYALTVQIRDARGELVREVSTLEPDSESPRRPYTMECSSGNAGFTAVGWGDTRSVLLEPGTVPQHVAPVWVMDEGGLPVTDLGEQLSSERVVSGNASGGMAITSAPHPFGRATVLALGRDEVFVSSGEALTINVHAREGGRLLRQIRGPDLDLAIAPAMVDAYRSAPLDESGERVRRSLEEQGLPMPETLPALTALRLDPEGALWAREFGIPGAVTERWGVFDADGIFLGQVTLPDRVRLMDLGTDWILGLATDEQGVQHVNLYRLIRG